jgi:hypothetical protein
MADNTMRSELLAIGKIVHSLKQLPNNESRLAVAEYCRGMVLRMRTEEDSAFLKSLRKPGEASERDSLQDQAQPQHEAVL